jgi:hypothetical protein
VPAISSKISQLHLFDVGGGEEAKRSANGMAAPTARLRSCNLSALQALSLPQSRLSPISHQYARPMPSFSIASRAVSVFRTCHRTCSNHLPIVEIVDDLRLGSAQHVVKRNKCGRPYTCGVLMCLSLTARCGASLHRSRIRTILSASSADGLGSHTV